MRKNHFLSFIVGTIGSLLFPVMLFAATGTIDASSYTARLCENTDCSVNSKIVWRTTHGTPVSITDTALTGYIWSVNFGWINLNPTHGGVHNTTGGVLSGYAWGQGAGWINFSPTHGGVTINTTTGEFLGWAWASSAGWIHFDCSLGANACVKTDWRPSSGTTTGTTTTGGSTGHGGAGGGTTGGTTGGTSGTTGTTGGDTGSTGTTTSGTDTGGSTTGSDTGGTTGGSDTGGTSGTTTGGTEGGGTTGEGGGSTSGTTGGSTGGEGGGGIGGGSTGSGGGSGFFGAHGVGAAITIVVEQIKTIGVSAQKVAVQTKTILNSKQGTAVTRTVSEVSAVGTVGITVATGIFLNPLALSDILLIPIRLISLLLGALGLTKRKKPWGVAYDSITKQPLDPVYVILRNSEGADVGTAITDLDGRYGFVVPQPGTYMLVAHKTNYLFPSQKLVGYDHDELYRDLYFGEYFTVANAGDVIHRNIPMDPERFDWNEFQKQKQHLMKFYSRREKWLSRLSNIFFGLGFVVSSAAVLASITKTNIIIFCLYAVLFFVRKIGLHARPYGHLSFTDGEPMPFSIVRVSQAATGVEVIHRVTDNIGRYYCLLPNGSYTVRIDHKLADGTYETVATGLPVTISKGYLSEKFVLPRPAPKPPAPLPPTPPVTPVTPPASPASPISPTSPIAPAAPVNIPAQPTSSPVIPPAPVPVVAVPAVAPEMHAVLPIVPSATPLPTMPSAPAAASPEPATQAPATPTVNQ